MASSFPPYNYSPLPSHRHIRLLEFPAFSEQEAALTGTLRVVDLDVEDSLPYVALSYTWGQPNFTEALLLDGSRVLHITSTLAGALRRFRYASALRWIWVDALCINQHDNAEKSRQIPLMADIYKGASRVMVWLGHEPGDASMLVRVKLLGSQARSLPQPSSSQEEDDAILVNLRTSLSLLGRLPYFTRRWIIQELSVNPNVVLCCGRVELPWSRLYGACGASVEDSGLRNIRLLWELWFSTAMRPIARAGRQDYAVRDTLLKDCDITTLMDYFSNFHCSDGHDRIAALLGLSTDAPAAGFKVAYADSVETTYIKFAESLANNGHMGWVLDRCFRRTTEIGSEDRALPSWVPDWRLASVGPLSVPRTSARCSIQALESSPGVHKLTAKFRLLRQKVASPIYDRPAPMEVVWKSALFSKGAEFEERFLNTIRHAWPIVARLKGCTKITWSQFLAQTLRMTAETCWWRARWDHWLATDGFMLKFADSSVPTEKDINCFKGLRKCVTALLRGVPKEWTQSPAEFAYCLVLCFEVPDAQGSHGICAFGTVASAHHQKVRVGHRLLFADLSPAHTDIKEWDYNTYIVHEDEATGALGSTDDLDTTDVSSLEYVPRLVYDFVAPCRLYPLFTFGRGCGNGSELSDFTRRPDGSLLKYSAQDIYNSDQKIRGGRMKLVEADMSILIR